MNNYDCLLIIKYPPLSHLFFADDFMPFGEATIENAENMKAILDDFCHSSGHKVNSSKSQLYFSKNMNEAKEKYWYCFGFLSNGGSGGLSWSAFIPL